MKILANLLIITTIITQVFSWKDYSATVSFSQRTQTSPKQETFSWIIPFRIDKKSMKYGYSTTVKLFNMMFDSSEKCKIFQTGDIPDWFAAYVKVPRECSRSKIVEQLITYGADFVFLDGRGSEEEFILNANGLHVPVFTVNNTLSEFALKVEARLRLEPKTRKTDCYKDSMQIHITMPNPPSKGGVASLDFFYSPANELTFNFSAQFTQVYDDIKDHVKFKPVIFLFSLPIDDPENCISGGLYCALDPDGEIGPLNGKMVIEESLRQKCIYNLNPGNWLKYMALYKKSCFNDFSKKCFSDTASKLSISVNKVQDCVDESFKSESEDGRTHNEILDQDLNTIATEQPDHSPALYINGVIYSGMIKSNYITNAICLTLETRPQICEEIQMILSIPDEEGYYETMVYVYSAFLLLIITAMICIVYQRWKFSSTMDDEVKKKIDRYYQLQGSEKRGD